MYNTNGRKEFETMRVQEEYTWTDMQAAFELGFRDGYGFGLHEGAKDG